MQTAAPFLEALLLIAAAIAMPVGIVRAINWMAPNMSPAHRTNWIAAAFVVAAIAFAWCLSYVFSTLGTI
jgi:hypothetical protein